MGNLCKVANWNDCQFVDWADCRWYSFQDPKDCVRSSIHPSRGGDKEQKIIPITKDYGRKPYLSRSYYEMMRRTSTRSTYDPYSEPFLQKKSQFEKPYLDDEYSEMQHWAPTDPPYDWAAGGDGVGPNPPFGSLPPPGDETKYGYFCSLTCWDDLGRCGGDECSDKTFGTCYTALIIASAEGFLGTGHWKVSGAPYKKLITGRGSKPGFKGPLGGITDTIEIYPDWDKIDVDTFWTSDHGRYKIAKYTVIYTSPDKTVCVGEVQVKCCEPCDCPANLVYSSTNPTTIARESEVVITVDAGCEPYYWRVSGTGFTFKLNKTNGHNNTLIADATACGMADIEVSDSCGEVTGEVSCTTGNWHACTGDYTEKECPGGSGSYTVGYVDIGVGLRASIACLRCATGNCADTYEYTCADGRSGSVTSDEQCSDDDYERCLKSCSVEYWGC